MMKHLITILATLALLPSFHLAHAGSASWVGAAPYGQMWETAGYWDPATVPQNPGDVATFDAGGFASCSAGFGSFNTDGIVFTTDAKAYNIASYVEEFNFVGPGIVNNSAIIQNFTAGSDYYPGSMFGFTFKDDSSAGDLVQLTSQGSTNDSAYGGIISFYDNSNAGTALINNQGSMNASLAGTQFYDSSSAQDASIINEVGTSIHYSSGGWTRFGDESSAGNANIVNEGGKYPEPGGAVLFFDYSSAGNSTITCMASSGGTVSPAQIWFGGYSDGGTSRIILNGDGTLNTYYRGTNLETETVTIGSLEGDGHVVMGWSENRITLAVGSNNLSTTFSVF